MKIHLKKALNKEKVSLKGFTITKDSIEERFGAELNDFEWQSFKKQIEQSWQNRDYGLEGVIVKHIRGSLEHLGFKAQIVDNKLKFQKE